ncbi:MAG TPA: spore coat protein [Clostridia bacterium]|nr:spore coat protein [Clostridia bacterium]
MSVNLTQKERALLEDQRQHEQLCIQKYTNYANQTQDEELRQLLNTYAAQEREHLNTINQILNGQVPNVSQQGHQGQQGQQMLQNNQMQSQSSQGRTMSNQGDATICKDLLMTEKYVSSTYDTAIFECRDSNIRQVLNHIQKEEQQHGEGIFNYMQSKGMYNPQ